MKFKYTALGARNQKLEGVLDAESIDIARDELHKMGMSIVAINEVTAEEAATLESKESLASRAQEGIITYYFVANDPHGKEVNGTIDSKDANSAFRRLFTEYQFEVLDLYPQDAPDPVAASLKPQFEEWKGQMQDEGIDFTHKSSAGTKGELDENDKIDEEVVAEMDNFIINSKKVLSEHRDQYTEAFANEIERTLNELERIRASNNIKHITKICNELYELISNPDAMKNQDDPEYKEVISKLKKSGFITNSFQFLELHNLQKKIARFEKVQTILAKIKKVLNRKNANKIDQELATRIKSRRARWISRLSRGLKLKGGSSGTSLFTVISKLFAFLAAPNSILRRARRQELKKTYLAWKKARKEPKEKTDKDLTTNEQETAVSITPDKPEKIKKDFSGFFMELDSFVGWLLFFYIAYFFLVSFAIERNIGLPKELVLKTLSSPLIVNISIFLIIAHLAFTLKIRLFRSNFIGSFFLFLFCFGLYTILIVNF